MLRGVKRKSPSIKKSPKTKAGKPHSGQKQAAPRTEAQYLAKPDKFEKDTWDRVLSVISKMRSDRVSLTQASRDAGTSLAHGNEVGQGRRCSKKEKRKVRSEGQRQSATARDDSFT